MKEQMGKLKDRKTKTGSKKNENNQEDKTLPFLTAWGGLCSGFLLSILTANVFPVVGKNLFYNPTKLEVVERDSRLPEVRENQSLILHPDYLSGLCSIGYTLLTDIDLDGNWDSAERVHGGFTTGDFSHKIYFKNGFEPERSTDIKYEFVNPEFFRTYE